MLKIFYRKNGKTYYIKNINGGNYRSNVLTINELKKWHKSGDSKGFKCDTFISIEEFFEYRELTGEEEMKMFRDLGTID